MKDKKKIIKEVRKKEKSKKNWKRKWGRLRMNEWIRETEWESKKEKKR